VKIGPADPEIGLLLGSKQTSPVQKKIVAMATSLEESEKLDLIKKIHANSNTFHLVKRS